MSPDIINGIFELGGGMLMWLSIMKLHKDKIVKGVHWAPVMFFALWGFWNLYFYPSLNQWYSFVAGIILVTTNTVWVLQLMYYLHKENNN